MKSSLPIRCLLGVSIAVLTSCVSCERNVDQQEEEQEPGEVRPDAGRPVRADAGVVTRTDAGKDAGNTVDAGEETDGGATSSSSSWEPSSSGVDSSSYPSTSSDPSSGLNPSSSEPPSSSAEGTSSSSEVFSSSSSGEVTLSSSCSVSSSSSVGPLSSSGHLTSSSSGAITSSSSGTITSSSAAGTSSSAGQSSSFKPSSSSSGLTCTDDQYEENDTRVTATMMTAGTYAALACPNDDDYYRVTLNENDVLRVTVTFDPSAEMNTYLLDPDGQLLEMSGSLSGQQVVETTAVFAGDYVVRVKPLGTEAVSYSMVLEAGPPVLPCVDDTFEPNDSSVAAYPLIEGVVEALTCPANDDWYAITVKAGETLEVAVTLAAGTTADLLAALMHPDGHVLDQTSLTSGSVVLHTVADVGGRFVVHVQGRNAARNSYQLDVDITPPNPVCTEDGYEQNDTWETAAAVVPGTIQGQVCPGDPDHFKVTVNQLETLRLTLAHTQANGDLDLQLLDSAGQLLRTSATTNNTESITYQAPTAGTFIAAVYGVQNATNSYALTVGVDPYVPPCTDDAFEENDSAVAAKPMTAGDTTGLKICGADEDWFSLAVAAGDTVQVMLHTITAGQNLDIQLLNSLGNVLATGATPSGDETVSTTVAAAGTVLARVVGAGQAADYSLNVTITAAPPPCTDDNKEPNDTLATAAVLVAGSHSGLQVCPGDDDYYAVDLLAGATLTATASFTHANGNLDMAVLDASGQVLATSTSSTNQESVQRTVTTASRLFIRVYGAPSIKNSYALTVNVTGGSTCTDDGFEENDAQATAATITAGTVQAVMCQNDPDFYKVTVNNGDTLTVDVLFTHANGNLDLRIRNSAGTVVGSSTGTVNNEHASYVATTGGTYFVEVYPADGKSSTYSLTVAISAAPTCTDDGFEENDAQATAATITAGTVQAVMCQNDPDFYKVTVNSGDTLTVDVLFTHANGNLDLRIRNSAGTVVASSTGTVNNEHASYVATTGGTYFVEVYPADGKSSTYSLTVAISAAPTCTDDGQEPNDSSTSAKPLAASPASLVVCSSNQDWFSLSLATGETLNASISFTAANGVLDLALLDTNGTTVLVNGTGSGGQRTLSYQATTAKNVFLRISAAAGISNAYSLTWNKVAAGFTCPADDPMEPNGTRLEATLLSAGTSKMGQICNGNEDWFAVALEKGDAITLDLTMGSSGGDLDLYLEGPKGTATSSITYSVNNGTAAERITYTATYPAVLFVRVVGYETAENRYTITSAVTQASGACVDDSRENNDTIAQAVNNYNSHLAVTDTVPAQVCGNDPDWYDIELYAYEEFLVFLRFDPSIGNLRFDLYKENSNGEDGTWLVDGVTYAPGAMYASFTATTTGYYWVHIEGVQGAVGPYTLMTWVE